jgi:hypothetical protein
LETDESSAAEKFDDEDYPAYTMGRAAEILGVTPSFLQLRLAARARELVDAGTALDAACRIIILEDQLAEALRINTELRKNT